MRIHDLTKEQCEMLDRLWACDTVEEIYELFKTLDDDKYKMALTLHQTNDFFKEVLWKLFCFNAFALEMITAIMSHEP